LAQYRPRGIRSLAVLLDTPTWAGAVNAPGHRAAATEESIALLRAAGWGVVVADPTTPMPQIWAELCHTAARRGTLIGGSL
jgi:hypothetical protein